LHFESKKLNKSIGALNNDMTMASQILWRYFLFLYATKTINKKV